MVVLITSLPWKDCSFLRLSLWEWALLIYLYGYLFFFFKCRYTKKMCGLEPKFQKYRQCYHTPRAQVNDINESRLSSASTRTSYQGTKVTLYPKEMLQNFRAQAKLCFVLFSTHSADQRVLLKVLASWVIFLDRDFIDFSSKAENILHPLSPLLKDALSDMTCPRHSLQALCQKYHSQEKIFHDIVVIRPTAVWQKTGSKHNDGI